MGQKKHIVAKPSKEWKFKASKVTISEKDAIKIKNTKLANEVIDLTIVKPKIERLQLQHGVKPEDLKEFVGPRDFLTKYKGVKQRMHEKKI